MKITSEHNTLIVAGLWNHFIFSPYWVGKNLFPETDITTEYPININGSPRYSNNKMRLFIIDNKLFLSSLKSELTIYDKIQEIALKISHYLPHTPVTAFGINFQFIVDNDELDIDVLKIPELDILKNKGLEPSSISYKYTFNKFDYILNLSIKNEKEKILFDFNNHFKIKSLLDFNDLIEKYNISSLFEKSKNMLNNIYLKSE